MARTKKPKSGNKAETDTGHDMKDDLEQAETTAGEAPDTTPEQPEEPPEDTALDEPEIAESEPEDMVQDEPQPEAEQPETRTPEPDEVVHAPAHASPQPQPRKGGFFPALMGGVLAAALGFVAARSEILDPYLPGGSDKAEMAETLAALRANDARQVEALNKLRADVDTIGRIDLTPIEGRIAALQGEIDRIRAESEARAAKLADFESRIAPLSARVDALEKQPMTDGASEAAIAAYDRELAALKQAIAQQRAEVESMIEDAQAKEAAARALEAEAEQAAVAAHNQATFARLVTALDNGAAYGSVLAELAAAGVQVPAALNESADTGVATLSALSDAFPAAARAALSAARASGEGGGGLTGFLQRQLGARSVKPKEGNDPDAILSRAEAALTNGDLATALDEIAALPETARAEMQGWVEMARTRLTALQAAEELAQSLNTN